MTDRAAYFRALAEEFCDQGRFIESGWCEIYANAPGELDPAVFELARMMFFRGAVHIFETTLAETTRGEKEGGEFLRLVKAEIREREQRDQLKYKPVVGNA